jgi:hypothetical protein
VTEVRLVIITVNNWGNEPIQVNDFERPLRFSWSEPAKNLTAEVIEVSPESLQPTITSSVNEIVVNPLLLNPGDWFRIKILINQYSKLSVDARVAGVKRVNKYLARRVTSEKTFRLIGVIGFLMLTLMLAGEGLGLWVANGQAEALITRAFVLVVLVLLADELKTGMSDLVSYFKNKDSPK